MNTAYMKRIIATVALAALSIGGLMSCNNAAEPTATATAEPTVTPEATPTATATTETVSIELDWYPNTNHVGIYVAQDRGYFSDENLEVEIMEPADPALVAQLVGSGERDFGVFYQTDTLLARNEGVPVVAVRSIVQRPLNCIMALKSSGIERPSDLKGKKIGYPGIDWNISLLETMLESDGLTLDDVEVVDIGWTLWQTLAAGTVDALIGAYWSHESYVLEDEGYPVNIIYADDYGVPPYYEMMLITSEQMLADQPDVVRRFANAFVRGYEWSRDNPTEAIDILVDLNLLEDTEHIERAAIPDLRDAWIAENGSIGTLTNARWESVGNFLKDKGYIEADLPVQDAWAAETFR